MPTPRSQPSGSPAKHMTVRSTLQPAAAAAAAAATCAACAWQRRCSLLLKMGCLPTVATCLPAIVRHTTLAHVCLDPETAAAAAAAARA